MLKHLISEKEYDIVIMVAENYLLDKLLDSLPSEIFFQKTQRILFSLLSG